MSKQKSRRRSKQLLMAMAMMSVMPLTGAFADTVANNLNQASGYQAAPPGKPVSMRWSRSNRVEHLEKVAHKLNLRIQRLQAEGQIERATVLQHRLSRIELQIDNLRT